LCNLLVFNSLGELFAECQVGDGNVLEGNVEFLGTFEEVGTNAIADGLTLRDEFCSIELSDDGFEDFVTDGWEDSLVVILTKVLMNLSVFRPLFVLQVS
jgi:hypothetical protein